MQIFWLALICLVLASPVAAAPVRGSNHGMTSAQLRQLRSLPVKPILPSQLPSGYTLKQVQVELKPAPRYQLEYRCFCGGQNYTIMLLGTTQPVKPNPKGVKFEKISVKGLGTQVQLGLYPAGQGFRQAYYLSSWLGKPPFQIGVVSALQGTRAPREHLIRFVQGLEYLK